MCWLISENKKQFPIFLALGAIGFQIVLILILFGIPQSKMIIRGINEAVSAVSDATHKGTQFVFGYLGGGAQPYTVKEDKYLFVFAFQVLPLILVISALSALLWHWRILKWITQGFSFVFEKTMGLSGACALSVASNIFLGMIECQIVIKAYLKYLSRSEVFMMMVVGLSCVSGSTMVAYILMLKEVLPNAAGHVLAASIISAPAGVLLSRIIVPKSADDVQSSEQGAIKTDMKYDSAMDAISKGTQDGLNIVLSISAILIVFVAIVALINSILGAFPPVLGAPLSLERILSYVFAPLAWLMGVPWHEAVKAGYILGTKLTLTEFVAFLKLGAIPAAEMSARTRQLLTYAICGFANIGSVGIIVSGFGVLMPERRSLVLKLVWKALFAGFLATCVSACVVGSLPSSIFGL